MEEEPTKIIICPSRTGSYVEDLTKELRAQGVQVSLLPWFGRYQAPYSIVRLLALRALGYRVLHVNWIPFTDMGSLRLVTKLCPAFGIKMVWTIHNLMPHNVQFGSEEKDKESMLLMEHWADKGVMHSTRARQAFGETYGTGLDIDIIHHGSYVGMVNPLDPIEQRLRLGIPNDTLAVLMFGPSRWNKGIKEFLEVVSHLPDGCVGLVAGDCRDPEIRSLIQNYKDRFPDKFILDLRDLSQREVAGYYAASDILLMPFERITTSSTIIEAMSFGRPVMTKNKGDMYEWVRNGKTGFLIDSPDEMIERLSHLNRADALEMGRNAARLAGERTWGETARRYAEVYRSVMDSIDKETP